MKPTITNRTTAPITALTIEPMKPENGRKPSCRSNQTTMKAPTMPRMMFQSSPNPKHRTICPASQPAMAPMISMMMMLLTSTTISSPRGERASRRDFATQPGKRNANRRGCQHRPSVSDGSSSATGSIDRLCRAPSPILRCSIKCGRLLPALPSRRHPMPAVARTKPPQAAGLKDLYDVGQIPPLGHVPAQMHAWAIRKERHGPPETSMQVEVLPTWPIGEDEVLVCVMAGGVNYNGVWAGLGIPISPLDVHKNPFHIAGSDASGVVWACGSKVRRWKVGDAVVCPRNEDDWDG